MNRAASGQKCPRALLTSLEALYEFGGASVAGEPPAAPDGVLELIDGGVVVSQESAQLSAGHPVDVRIPRLRPLGEQRLQKREHDFLLRWGSLPAEHGHDLIIA